MASVSITQAQYYDHRTGKIVEAKQRNIYITTDEGTHDHFDNCKGYDVLSEDDAERFANEILRAVAECRELNEELGKKSGKFREP